MMAKTTFRIIDRDDLHLAESLFVGDTSNHVAPPNTTWWNYVTTAENVRCILHFQNDTPIAITQFDLEDTTASVSVFIREGMRGKGLFNGIIKDAISLLPSQILTVNAYISEANHPSISAFTNFGFEGAMDRDDDGLLIFRFALTPR